MCLLKINEKCITFGTVPYFAWSEKRIHKFGVYWQYMPAESFVETEAAGPKKSLRAPRAPVQSGMALGARMCGIALVAPQTAQMCVHGRDDGGFSSTSCAATRALCSRLPWTRSSSTLAAAIIQSALWVRDSAHAPLEKKRVLSIRLAQVFIPHRISLQVVFG